MSEIGWLKWGTDLINFFQCSWESISSIMCPGHSGEEMTLIKQKKRLSPKKPVSQYEFLPYFYFNYEYSPGGSRRCARCRVCSRNRQGAQWLILDSKKFRESWHWFSSLSLPELPGPRMRDELCVHKQRTLWEPLQWPESQAVLDGWKRSLA